MSQPLALLTIANPSDCEDWHVPVALVNLNEIKDDNWDITAARVAQFIDGINHVKRIAELADADPALTRETIKHMLYYQVVMMVSETMARLIPGRHIPILKHLYSQTQHNPLIIR